MGKCLGGRGCLDPHEALQASTCSVYDLEHAGNTQTCTVAHRFQTVILYDKHNSS